MALSIIDAHPLRNKVVEYVLKGGSYRNASTMLGLPYSTVNLYFRKHMQSVKAQAKDVSGISRFNDGGRSHNPGVEPAKQHTFARSWYTDHIAKRQAQLESMIAKTVDADLYKDASALMARDSAFLELHAKVTGVLDNAPRVEVNIASLLPTYSTEPVDTDYSLVSDEE